jgi:hypothetical protein
MRFTVSAVCHLEGALVGITRATGGVYGWGNSNFTYVEVNVSRDSEKRPVVDGLKAAT